MRLKWGWLFAGASAATLALSMAPTAMAAPAHATNGAARPVTAFGVAGRSVAAARAEVGPGTAAWHKIPGTMVAGVGESGGSVVVGNDLYVPGGYTGSTCCTTQSQYMQYLNLSNGQWTQDTTAMPSGPLSDAAVCDDPSSGLVYVVNGVASGLYYNGLQIYNTATHTWSTGATPPFNSQDSGCGVINGVVYVFGGYYSGGLTTTYSYNPTTQQWANTNQTMVTPTIWSSYVTSGSEIIEVGGELPSLTGSTNQVEAYTVSGGWKAMANLPNSLAGAGVAAVGKTLAVFGGGNGGQGAFTAETATYTCSLTSNCASWKTLGSSLNLPQPTMFQAYGSAGSHGISTGGENSSFSIYNNGFYAP